MTATSWTHEHRFKLSAPAARVFAACTTPAELEQWFAEHVEIDLRLGGTFRAWGRYTYGQTAAGAIREIDPDRVLAFDWTFDGVPSRVTWTLNPDPKGDDAKTQFALTHTFDRSSGVAYERELVDDLWRFVIGNLDAHLRGGAGIVRPDFTDPNQAIRMSIVIDAPREKIFRALVVPELMAKWLGMPGGTAPTVEARVGGRFQYGWKYEINGKKVDGGPTKVLDLVENERLVTDWLDWRGDTSRPPTRLAWILEEIAPNQTRVTLIHDQFSRTADIGDYPFGWLWWMGKLKSTVEGSL